MINLYGHDYFFSVDCEKAINRLQAEKKRLRDALQSLYNEQNGPPLIRDKKEWQEAMDEAETLLGDKP